MDRMTRCKVLLTSLELFGIPHLPEWTGAEFHVDWECSTEDGYDQMGKNWERSYCKSSMPVDTVAFGGLHDIKPIVESVTDVRGPSLNMILDTHEVKTKILHQFHVLKLSGICEFRIETTIPLKNVQYKDENKMSFKH